jgi:phthiodiolone/phenolphthiodiolone dimycocerosates ketoreductase
MVRFASFLRFSPLEKLLKDAKRAEQEGFQVVCYGDHLLYPPLENQVFDAWLVLASIALGTKRIQLAPCVTDIYRRHPAQMAQTIATLDRMSNGRAFVMLGAGEAMNLSPFGISYEPKIKKLKETIDVLRLLWTSKIDQPVDYDGEFLKLHGAYLQVKPVQKPSPPIYLSALSPKSMRLAAEAADGWLTHIESPETFLNGFNKVKAYAEKSGRQTDLDTALFLPIAISEDENKAKSLMKLAKGILVLRPDKLNEAGYSISIPDELRMKNFLLDERGDTLFQDYFARIPDEWVEPFVATGNADQCIEKIERFAKNGAKLFILVNLNPQSDEFYRLVGSKVIPYFKEEQA